MTNPAFPFQIRALATDPATAQQLCTLLIQTVANGESVSFMHPLAPQAAEAFWADSLAAADQGKRMVLGAWQGNILIGTVTLLLDFPPNQPHRAEIAKMMTRLGYRGQGIATALLQEAERLAEQHGRTLLVLDTATDGGAAGLYEKMGYTLAGEIPDFALKPYGGLTGTLLYWKRLKSV
ncbi:GNAT family N-acetyltransferase [Deinococcus oregonensis]|uniref:GNAT family N-acetyltransferase n=1 Tax=Deinococcus oregonensis TaxID=1805970 RepID=A0ABV6B178_9DEIO